MLCGFVGIGAEEIPGSIPGLEISNEDLSEHWIVERTEDVWTGRFD